MTAKDVIAEMASRISSDPAKTREEGVIQIESDTGLAMKLQQVL